MYLFNVVKGSWSDLLSLLRDDTAVNRPPITPEAPGETYEGDFDQELTFLTHSGQATLEFLSRRFHFSDYTRIRSH